ncbi:MAG: hypothetical protein IPI35_26710 [Deltaproteobacteria bacterium]|nr:hypothetical protein [Deltaproteobacteria bacterium]
MTGEQLLMMMSEVLPERVSRERVGLVNLQERQRKLDALALVRSLVLTGGTPGGGRQVDVLRHVQKLEAPKVARGPRRSARARMIALTAFADLRAAECLRSRRLQICARPNVRAHGVCRSARGRMFALTAFADLHAPKTPCPRRSPICTRPKLHAHGARGLVRAVGVVREPRRASHIEVVDRRGGEGGVELPGRGEPGLEGVAEGHQRVNFGDDAVLFGEGGTGAQN